MMFPSDALTVHHELVGESSYTLVSGTSPKTILGISIQQSKDLSDSYLKCNDVIIAKNYAKDLPFNAVIYYCPYPISVSKTGQDSASFIVTYVNRNISLEPATITTASVSGTVNINYAPPAAVAMHDMTYVIWMGQAMVLLVLGVLTFLLYMKRR